MLRAPVTDQPFAEVSVGIHYGEPPCVARRPRKIIEGFRPPTSHDWLKDHHAMKKSSFVQRLILAVNILLLLGIPNCPAHAAPGDVDLSFDPGLGVNGPVNAVVVQPDGKMIIGGQFTTVRGFARTNLARLNADGSGDPTFDPGQAFRVVDSLARQPDGKLLVGSQYDYILCDEEWGCESFIGSVLTRLHSDGTVDTGFSNAVVNVGSPYGFSVLTLQPDNKILVGGQFTEINGTNRNGIARLHADGTLDLSFDPGSGVGGHEAWVYAIATQPDGKVLVGGMFDSFDGTNRNGIARLNSNGSLDAGYNPGTHLGGSYPRVQSIAVLTNDQVLIGGYFTNVTGSCVARLNSNGSLDGGFIPDLPIGVITSPFDSAGAVAVAVQPDGKVVVGGIAIRFQGCDEFGGCTSSTTTSFVARLEADGSRDPGFTNSSASPAWWAALQAIVAQPDGKTVIGGAFAEINGARHNRIARLNVDGSIDESFDPGQGLERAVSQLALQPDGKVLLGGTMTAGNPWWGPLGDTLPFVNGTNYYGRLRLHADGSVDRAFVSSTNFNLHLDVLLSPVDCLGDPRYGCSVGVVTMASLVQHDGKVLLSGYVETSITGEEVFFQIYRSFLARFHEDGSWETNFTHLTNAYITTMTEQADGKILVGGSLSWNGTNSTVARLNADGSVDGSFQLGNGPASVSCLALLPNGKVVVGGANTVARLKDDGSQDLDFNPVVLSTGEVQALALQPDGKVLIGGSFTSVNGTNRIRLARLNADGSLDGSFDPGTGADGMVRYLALQPDGNVLIAGDFTTVNGVMRQYVARLYGDAAPPSLSIVRSNESLIISWPVSATGFQLQQSTNLGVGNWTPPPEATIDNGTTRSITVSPAPGNRWFRLFRNQ